MLSDIKVQISGIVCITDIGFQIFVINGSHGSRVEFGLEVMDL